jgi:hypothetical protein
MFAEASNILRAVAADFYFNCWYLEISSDDHSWHVPSCVRYNVQGLRLETLQNFYVGCGSHTPECYSVSPDIFGYCFGYEKFVVCGEFSLACE